jgi:FKBP-type peptidyl-prolyl cis-trans isomerase FklB
MNRIIFALIVLALAGCSDSGETPEQVEMPDPAVTGQDARAGEAAAEQMMGNMSGESDEIVDPGQAYLYINARKPGVQVTKSGLQFEMLEQGEGKTPGLTSSVLTHYHGTLVDGTVFDSSVERGQPAQFPVNRVIAGWTEALQMMKEGDKWRLVIPPDLAYGERGSGRRVPPNSVLVFELELIEVKD